MDKQLKKQTIETIKEKLLNKIQQYHTTRSVTHLTLDDRKIMRQVWKAINPTSYFNDSCASCLKTILDITESWYSRESAREMQSDTIQEQVVKPSEDIIITEHTIEEIKPIDIKPKKITKKKKTNGKKNNRNRKGVSKHDINKTTKQIKENI